MTSLDYVVNFKNRIDNIYSGGFSCLSKIDEIPAEVSQNILIEILETGCKSQNHINIELGRDAITKIPEDWLLNNLPVVIKKHMFLKLDEQEWEFRRLAEMLKLHFPTTLNWLIGYAKLLNNPEVDEAIVDLT